MPIDLNSIADQIAVRISDYREGEITRPDRAHVLRWVNQFDTEVREALLIEANHFLSRMYVQKSAVLKFVKGLVQNPKLSGGTPKEFWSSVGFLSLQTRSQSQRDMLDLLSGILSKEYGIQVGRRASNNSQYIYIDDAIFSGHQVKGDLEKWVKGSEASDCTVHIIVIGFHKSGQWYADRELRKIASGRRINFKWWRIAEIEDWKKPENVNSVDVLWPMSLPDEKSVKHWLKSCPDDLKYFSPRPPGTQGNPAFASEAGRNVLEQQFLIKGAYIRSMCKDPSVTMRPLGFQSLRGPGFGTLFSTYRNCPNNAPLVLWWGLNQWHPLLPRRIRATDW